MKRCGLDFSECYQVAECIREDAYQIAELAHEMYMEFNSDGRSPFREEVLQEVEYLKEYPQFSGIIERML